MLSADQLRDDNHLDKFNDREISFLENLWKELDLFTQSIENIYLPTKTDNIQLVDEYKAQT